MSSHLWKFYLEDDVDSFRRLLAEAGYVTGPFQHKSVHRPPQRIGGSATSSLGTSGATSSTSKARKASAGGGHGGKARASRFAHGHWTNLTLARADINLRDRAGLTILHHASSSSAPDAIGFATALIDHPLVDLYLQDEENGWTALHRALYFGNVTTARAILTRDMSDAVGHDRSGVALHAGGIIRVKDNEGNSPFDLFNATIPTGAVSRRLFGDDGLEASRYDCCSINISSNSSCSSCKSIDHHGSCDLDHALERDDPDLAFRTKLEGDEVYMFGSNKNLNLGFGDEDDRQYPERLSLRRPDHLCFDNHRSFRIQRHPFGDQGVEADPQRFPSRPESMPVSLRYKALAIRDVAISKFHTAIVTTDELANLYVCGYGAGGRLGTGDEATRFTFVCVEGGGLARKHVIGVGLGQNHTLATTSDGEVFTWGTNTYGQLGYALPQPQPQPGDDGLVQASPRRLFGPLKREFVIGVAASRIHSVVHTATKLYTFGKNEGQLGFVASDTRALEVQPIPRSVGLSQSSSRIRMVSAIDRATVCLLEHGEVLVFANFGCARLSFPAEAFDDHFVGPALGMSKFDRIFKIFSGGDTICALSGLGDVFALRVDQKLEPGPAEGSTTNPNKLRSALTHPQRIWSSRKVSMAVRDLGIGQDGSIIICTQSGSVWRRERRTKQEKVKPGRVSGPKSKDFKFSRVPGLTRIAAVRSNAVGVFSAIRKDDDVMKTHVTVEESSMQADTTELLSFRDVLVMKDSDDATTWPSATSIGPKSSDVFVDLPRRVVGQEPAALEADVAAAISRNDPSTDLVYDADLCTTTSPVRIPVHRFILARSLVIDRALTESSRLQDSRAPDLFSISSGHGGRMEIMFQGLDFLVLLNLVLYLYADKLIPVWAPTWTRSVPQQVSRLRQARTELLRLASSLELRHVETAMWYRRASMAAFRVEIESALTRPEFSDHADTIVELDGAEVKVHSALMCQRCPFFHGLFRGRSAGQWLSTRDRGDGSKAIKVDLAHVNPVVFQFVLRYVYADADEAMFEDVVTADVDEFLDLVVEVLSVANELMLERLCRICQKVLGRFVTARNACPLLNAVAPSSVTAFKDACLEYLCFGLEGMLENQSVVQSPARQPVTDPSRPQVSWTI